MKKLIPFLALAILISSCGNKMTLLKRHYTKGYYVQNSKSPDKISSVKTLEVSTNKMKPIEVSFVKETQPPILAASLKIENRSISSKSYQCGLRAIASVKNYPVYKTGTPSVQKSDSFPVRSSMESKKDGDGNLIVMVILACFPILCLIAVYLHDNGITTNFWIDLLLHLTFIGEIIFALLVVLDVVNFA